MKFYEFKNITSLEADLYIYGEIVQEKSVDFWTGEESQTEVGLMDFKKELEDLGNVQTLNLYINSPGGEVFTASTMISLLERQKAKGTIINAYVDGLSASAASFLMMVADNIYIYKNSVVMIHKPMSVAWGNVNEMQKTIDALNKIEDSVMIPMYMSKAKVDEAELRELIDAETWLSASDMDKYFNINLINEEKLAVASIDNSLLKMYKNVPDFIKNSLDFSKNSEKSFLNEQNSAINLENEEKTREIQMKIKLNENLIISKNVEGKE